MGSRDSRNLPQIDGFTVEREIGTGGFSRVYRATQHGLERPVAIKVLNAGFEDERQQRTFERECRVMGQLSTHPNIVTVFASAMTNDGHPCIVMELYEGTYRSDEQLSIPEVVDVGVKIAGALQTIHDGGIVHRDIKPHNIFVSAHGEPAIGDFGISSIDSERTVTGGAGFSINYAPPEVFEDAVVGAAGDVYSLGATLYQLASGEVPFPHTGDPAEKTRATVHKIITAPPPSLVRSDAPPELDRLLRRCMAKRRDDRPARASDVAESLLTIQASVGRPSPRKTVQRFRETGDGGRPGSRTSDEPFASQPPERTSGVTVVRDRLRPPQPIDEDDGREEAASTGRPRGLLVGLAVSVAILVISGLAIVVSQGGSDDGEAAAASTTVPPTTVDRFQVLRAPSDLSVTSTGDRVYELTWSSTQDDVSFQILLIGSGENRIADTTSYTWTLGDDPAANDGPVCFEVRTTNDEATRVSQTAAGPVCG